MSMSSTSNGARVLPLIAGGSVTTRQRSRSKVEDQIASLRQNLFMKLEKYEMETKDGQIGGFDENRFQSASDAVYSNLNNSISGSKPKRSSLNASFDSENPRNTRAKRATSFREPEQLIIPQSQSIRGSSINNTMNRRQQSSSNSLLRDSAELNVSLSQRKVLPQLKKRDTNVSAQSSESELSSTIGSIASSNGMNGTSAALKAGYLQLKKVVFKDPKGESFGIPPKKTQIGSFKTRSKSYHITNNIAATVPHFLPISGTTVVPNEEGMKEVEKIEDKKDIFKKTQVVKGRIEVGRQYEKEDNKDENNEDASDNELEEAYSEQRAKSLQEYHENYTGLEDGSDYDDEAEEDEDIEYEQEEERYMLEEFQKLFDAAMASKKERNIQGAISGLKSDYGEIERDIKYLKEMFCAMRPNWKALEKEGVDFSDVDAFIKNIDSDNV